MVARRGDASAVQRVPAVASIGVRSRPDPTDQSQCDGCEADPMVLFRERLWVPWWAWPAAISWPVALGVAYGYVTTATVGLLVGVLLSFVVAAALIRAAVLIVVDQGQLRAGRAMLEAEYLGTPTPLDREAARRLRGVAADGRAFSVVRGWVATGVRVDVDDSRDPTPYWYLSTRRPEALTTAINLARGHATIPTNAADPGET